MRLLFLSVLIIFLLFSDTVYSMHPKLAKWITDYRTKKDAFLKKSPNKEKIAENIFSIQVGTGNDVFKSDIFQKLLHFPQEQLIHYRKPKEIEEFINRELINKSSEKIFFYDNPVWHGEEKILRILDEEGKYHTINNYDLFLFFNDLLSPAIYTDLIPQELVQKDRDTLKAFMLVSKYLKKEKMIAIPSAIFKNVLAPFMCLNIKSFIVDRFCQMENKTIQLTKDSKDFIEEWEKWKENDDSCSDYIINAPEIFFRKSLYLFNNFNFAMIQKIIGHYFVKENSR